MTPQIRQRIEQIRRGEVPEGYTKIKDGVFPSDWTNKKMKQWISLEERPIILQDEEDYELVTVRRAYGGVDSRGVHKGKDILVKTYFGVEEDDFIISKRQIAHGACGLVPSKLHGAVVSNEYNVFKANQGTNIHFFNLMMQLPHYKRLFYLMSDGVHIEKLLFKTGDWMKRSLAMPSLAEQQKIAEILSAQDKLIALKEKLIEEKKRQKKYLMQQIFFNRTFKDKFSSQWDTVELQEIFEYEQPTKYLVETTDYSNKYSTPVLTAGKSFVLGYTNEVHGIYKQVPVIIFDDFTTDSKYVDFPFKAKSSAMKILNVKENYDIRFAFELLQSINYVVCGHERHWISVFSHMTVDVPSYEAQVKISRIIEKADKEIKLLEKDLNQEKQKKKALMQLLLTGIVRVNP